MSYGVRKAEKDGEISRPTLYYARKGENISLDSAYTICHKYNLKFNEYFDKGCFPARMTSTSKFLDAECLCMIDGVAYKKNEI